MTKPLSFFHCVKQASKLTILFMAFNVFKNLIFDRDQFHVLYQEFSRSPHKLQIALLIFSTLLMTWAVFSLIGGTGYYIYKNKFSK